MVNSTTMVRPATAGLSARKHAAIERAGTAVFLRHGYESASMDAIAAEAGVSKQTVYNHFRSKEALFKAIIESLSAGLLAPLEMHEAANAEPPSVLGTLGRDLLSLMLQPSSLALYRLIVAESARFPELGGDIYAIGTGRLIAMLARYLAWETDRGRLAVTDAAAAAELFIGMLSGRAQLRALLGVETAPDPAAIDRRVALAVSGFLKIYGPAR